MNSSKSTKPCISENVEQLSNLILGDNDLEQHFVLGIDGLFGAGKSTLAKQLSENMKIPVIELDNYRKEPVTKCVNSLKVTELKDAIAKTDGRYIIEGACLAAIAIKVGIQLSKSVYVKRIGPAGIWLDEKECDPQEEENDLLNRIEDEAQIGSMLDGQQQDEDEHYLIEMRKEVIQYHYQYKPANNADYLFHRIE